MCRILLTAVAVKDHGLSLSVSIPSMVEPLQSRLTVQLTHLWRYDY